MKLCSNWCEFISSLAERHYNVNDILAQLSYVRICICLFVQRHSSRSHQLVHRIFLFGCRTFALWSYKPLVAISLNGFFFDYCHWHKLVRTSFMCLCEHYVQGYITFVWRHIQAAVWRGCGQATFSCGPRLRKYQRPVCFVCRWWICILTIFWPNDQLLTWLRSNVNRCACGWPI